MNVGPNKDGMIVPIFQERLAQMGEWLKINGEAVYSTKPWVYQNDTFTPNIWFTSKLRSADQLDPRRIFNPQIEEKTLVYAFLLNWPKDGSVKLGAPKAGPSTKISLLGTNLQISFEPLDDDQGIQIDLSGITFGQLPSTHAWVLKLEFLLTDHRVPEMNTDHQHKKFRKNYKYF